MPSHLPFKSPRAAQGWAPLRAAPTDSAYTRRKRCRGEPQARPTLAGQRPHVFTYSKGPALQAGPILGLPTPDSRLPTKSIPAKENTGLDNGYFFGLKMAISNGL